MNIPTDDSGESPARSPGDAATVEVAESRLLRGRRLRPKLLTGNLSRTVLYLALPVLFEQFLSFLVGTCDIFLAGHLDPSISKSATSAVGVAAYVGWLASMLFSLVGAGTTALVARHWGAGQHAEANRIANCSLTMALGLGLLSLCAIWPTASFFPQQLGMDAETSTMTTHYLRFDAIGLVFTSLCIAGAAALRGSGDMRTPMLIFGTVSVVNIFASVLLVYGLGPIPAMGVDGIVAGTVVARFSGGVLLLFSLAWGHSGLGIILNELRVTAAIAKRILSIGLPAAIDSAILWTGHFLFLKIISGLGSASFAAHMVGIRVEAITYLPAVAWGAAAATMVGQSLGANQEERAVASGHHAVRQCSVVGLTITVLFYFGAETIYRFMHNDPQVIEVGVPAFRIVALFQVPLVISIIYVAALRGAGDTRFPLLMTLLSTFGLRVPLAWFFAIHMQWGLTGAWMGMCADMLVRSLMATTRFVRQRWLKTVV
ncbi:MAG: MATE family efflux transporter [Planctomycetaceae bacterium]